MFRMTIFGWIVFGYSFVTTGFQSNILATELPKCIDSSLTIELVASEPEIVTPVSCRFDSKGRLFVVESHTHFPPENYEGPSHDRIKLFDDPDGDGKLDRIRVFYEGTKKTMSLAIGRDDSIYVATRAAILKLRDTNGDDVADEVTTIISLDTVADYPHNGLSGLLLEESDGKTPTLTFGLGENFGEKYELRGSDGSLQTGKGEGGNIFQCSPDGSNLRRVATGFWNPFGICRDDGGRLLMVDNDADAMPPCRIVHVVPQGDYGFQFRFGRAGTHPLQAWNGELPGTLPMVAGTGEAPCSIICHRGQYWVTSWGDNRIERYTPKHHGAATIVSSREDAVIGGSMFRPVDMTIASDGSMYVTDWVDRSYNVHRKGRIWRIRSNTIASNDSIANKDGMKPSLAETDVKAFVANHRDIAKKTLLGQHSDPFLLHAITSLSNFESWLPNSGLEGLEHSPVLRRARILNARWKVIACDKDALKPAEVVSMIEAALGDDDESVRMVAVKWAAETGDKALLPAIKEELNKDSISPQFLAMVSATISYLETGKVEKGGFDSLTRDTLVRIANDGTRSDRIRTMALLLVPSSSSQWNLRSLASIVESNKGNLARAAARHISTAPATAPNGLVVQSLLANPLVSDEIKKDLFDTHLNREEKRRLDKQPKIDDLEAWLKQVGEGGDVAKGWRLFFSKGKCAACHMRDGRGSSVGPDLTNIRTMAPDRKRLLESILHPSREIGPMYTTWKVLTKDGQVIVGLKLNGGGVGQSARYLLADSTTVDVKLEDIEEQAASEKSIMPEGLVQSMNMEEIRDLLAFLASPPES